MNKLYEIKGTKHLDPSKTYISDDLYPDFQEKLAEFKSLLLKSAVSEFKVSSFRLGDGDYFFYKKIPTGVAKPGNYGYKNKKFLKNNEKFVKDIKKFNIFQSLINGEHPKRFFDFFEREMDYPVEFTYGLVANKWLIQIPNIKIGLIGASSKIKLIQELIQYKEYQEYLGVEKFEHYIPVPQNFLVDKAEKTLKKIIKEVDKNGKNVNMYIYGLGYGKSYIVPKLMEKYKNLTFIDAGVSIDALAGVVNIERPYFGLWKNFQIKNKPKLYKEVDFLFRKGTLGDISHL